MRTKTNHRTKHLLLVFHFSLFLVLAAGEFGELCGEVGEAREIHFVPHVSARDGIEPSFCLDGSVMTQLLQGFGSVWLADEVAGYRLNCGARILREEIIDNHAVLDVEVECECVDPDVEGMEPMNVKGQWSLSFDL